MMELRFRDLKLKKEVRTMNKNDGAVVYNRKNEIAKIEYNDINAVGDDIGILDVQVKLAKKQYEDMKSALLRAFEEYRIKKWETPNGTQITYVAAIEGKDTYEFDFERFANEHPDMVEQYQRPTRKSGRSAFIKITPPKE